MRLLKERAALTRQVANRLRASGETKRAEQIEEQAGQDDDHVLSLRALVESNVDPLAVPIASSSSVGEQ